MGRGQCCRASLDYTQRTHYGETMDKCMVRGGVGDVARGTYLLLLSTQPSPFRSFFAGLCPSLVVVASSRPLFHPVNAPRTAPCTILIAVLTALRVAARAQPQPLLSLCSSSWPYCSSSTPASCCLRCRCRRSSPSSSRALRPVTSPLVSPPPLPFSASAVASAASLPPLVAPSVAAAVPPPSHPLVAAAGHGD